MSNPYSKSGTFELYVFAFAAFAICALVMGAGEAQAPAAAASTTETQAADGSGYFPAQYVNQAKEIEPMPEMYY